MNKSRKISSRSIVFFGSVIILLMIASILPGNYLLKYITSITDLRNKQRVLLGISTPSSISVPLGDKSYLNFDGNENDWSSLPFTPYYSPIFHFYGDTNGDGTWGDPLFSRFSLFYDDPQLVFYFVIQDYKHETTIDNSYNLLFKVLIDTNNNSEWDISADIGLNDFHTPGGSLPGSITNYGAAAGDVPYLEFAYTCNLVPGNTYRIMFLYQDQQTDTGTKLDTWPLDDSGTTQDDSSGNYLLYIPLYIQKDTQISQISGLTANPSSYSSINNFAVSWTSVWDYSGIAGAYYKKGSAPTSNTNGTYVSGSGITSITGLTSYTIGQNDIWVWVKDSVGNVNYLLATSTSFYYDPNPPATPTSLSWTQTPYSTTTNVNANWQAVTDISSIINYYIQLAKDTSTFTSPVKACWINSTTPQKAFGASDGILNGHAYYFRVLAKNGAGLNSSYSSASSGVVIDTDLPNISNITNHPAIVYDTDTVDLNVDGTDANGVKNVTLLYTTVFKTTSTDYVINMTHVTGNRYHGNIPAYQATTSVIYQFKAYDTMGRSSLVTPSGNNYVITKSVVPVDSFLSVIVPDGVHNENEVIVFKARPFFTSNNSINVTFGGITLQMNDNGINGDDIAADGWFSAQYTIPANPPRSVQYTVIFQSNRSAYDNSKKLYIDTNTPSAAISCPVSTGLEIFNNITGEITTNETNCTTQIRVVGILDSWTTLQENAPFHFAFSTSVLLKYQGVYTIETRVVDLAGHVGSAIKSISIDNTNAHVIYNDLYLLAINPDPMYYKESSKVAVSIQNANSTIDARDFDVYLYIKPAGSNVEPLLDNYIARGTSNSFTFYGIVPKISGNIAFKVGLYYKGHFVRNYTMSIEVPVNVGLIDVFGMIYSFTTLFGGIVVAVASTIKAIKVKPSPKAEPRRHPRLWKVMAVLFAIIAIIGGVLSFLNDAFGVFQFLIH